MKMDYETTALTSEHTPGVARVISYMEKDGNEEDCHVRKEDMWMEINARPFQVTLLADLDNFPDLAMKRSCSLLEFLDHPSEEQQHNFNTDAHSYHNTYEDYVESRTKTPEFRRLIERLDSHTSNILKAACENLAEKRRKAAAATAIFNQLPPVSTAASGDNTFSDNGQACFDPTGMSTKDLVLNPESRCEVVKTGGLYRSIRANKPIPVSSSPHSYTYFEVHISGQSSQSGACIGLSPSTFSLNDLVGSKPNTLGYSLMGYIVLAGTWTEFGPSSSAQDDDGSTACSWTIGCLCNIVEGDDSYTVSTAFLLDGKPLRLEEDAGTDLAEASFITTKYPKRNGTDPTLLLFPTVTLHENNSAAQAVFSLDAMQDGVHNSPLFAALMARYGGVEIRTLDGERINVTPVNVT